MTSVIQATANRVDRSLSPEEEFAFLLLWYDDDVHFLLNGDDDGDGLGGLFRPPPTT